MTQPEPLFITRLFTLKVGTTPQLAAELLAEAGRARWLDSWGAGPVPGLGARIEAVSNVRGTKDTLACITYCVPATPVMLQQQAIINLNFYHHLLHWERAIHFYLAEKRRLAFAAVNDVASLKYPPYRHDDDIATLVQEFEFSLLPSSLWRHPQHLTIILWYLLNHTALEAEARFRDCTKRYIARYPGFGRYSETITMFWIRWVKAWLRSADRSWPHYLLCNELLLACAGSGVIHTYYTPHRLFAASSWEVTALPDRQPFDFEPVMTPPGHVSGFRPFTVPVQVFASPFPVDAADLRLDFAADGTLTIALNATLPPITSPSQVEAGEVFGIERKRSA